MDIIKMKVETARYDIMSFCCDELQEAFEYNVISLHEGRLVICRRDAAIPMFIGKKRIFQLSYCLFCGEEIVLKEDEDLGWS